MKTLITLLITLFSFNLQANDHLKYAVFNTGINAIIGGLGSGIHKKHNESFFHAFRNGFYKGSIGGLTSYYGMRLVEVSASKDNLNYIWPGRIVNAIGSSITYNAVANDKIWSSFNMNMFCFNVQYNGKFHLRVDPLSLGYATVLAFTKDMNFNFRNSLLTGSLLFYKQSDTTTLNLVVRESGKTIGNTFYIKPDKQFINNFYYSQDKSFVTLKRSIINLSTQLINHEIIHTFQYEQFSSLNLLSTDKICKSIHSNINDWLYINPNFGIIYLLGNIKGYDNNIFEHEADLFGKVNYYHNNIYH